MIKEIIKDNLLLSRKSVDASKEDLSVVTDLLDTIEAHKEHCVGLAANMIGIYKRIIVIYDNTQYVAMINPVIIKTGGHYYSCQEGCLCHSGQKETKRFEKIKVAYYDIHFKKKIKTFSHYPAQIIQHEIDHCNGILI